MLAAANPKVKPRRLRVGQLLIVPTGGGISTHHGAPHGGPEPRRGHQHLGLSPGARGETLSGSRTNTA